MILQDFKESFPRSKDFIHLNNAGLAPSSRAAWQTVRYWIDRFHNEGMHCNDDYMAAAEIARAQLAKLLGADADEIAFFQSTAGGISQVALGMKLEPGDEIVVWDQDYPSLLYPWQAACDRSGAKIVITESDPELTTPAEKILAKVTERTKVIAISWVQYQTGAVTDIEKIAAFAKPRGIWVVVDVIQGFGIRPLDFHKLGVDAVCGGSHKWLVSPVGVGFLAIRRDRVPKLAPLTIGSSTYGTCDDATDLACIPKPGALRFESGSKQVLEITALGASAALIDSIGVEILQTEAERLAHLLREGLREFGYEIHSPGEPVSQGAFVNISGDGIASKLQQARISFAFRGPGIRLSPHAFNSDDDIERTLRCLRK